MKKGQALWEFTALLAVVFVAYVWFTSGKSTNSFGAGSQQVTHTAESRPFVSLFNFNWSSSGEAKTVAKKQDGTITQVTAVKAPVEEPIEVSTIPLDLPKIPVNAGHLSIADRFVVDGIVMLIVIAVGGLLDALGGKHWLFCRRFIMPFLVMVGVGIVAFSFVPHWWACLAGLLLLPSMGLFTIGYPSGDNFGRALWLFIQSLGLGTGLVLFSYFFHVHLLAWYLFLWYVVSTGVWGGLYKNWKQFKGDWITGSWLCSLILYVFITMLFSL